jgi:hypothetical protein
MDEDLRRIGDELERAVGAVISDRRNTAGRERHEAGIPSTQEVPMLTTRRSHRRIVIATVAGGLVLAAAGTAAARSWLLSDHDVAQGMPGGSAIFEGTHPTCESGDGITFTCVLASAPTVEVLSDYTGTKELIVDSQGLIAGGCIGQDLAGLHWTCYVGQRAADEGILAPDLLGQPSNGPGHG